MNQSIIRSNSGDPIDRQSFVRNIALDLVLTLLLCGLFNLYVQYKQMQAVNYMLGEQKYNFLPWLLLTIVTCGLYHIYHEYRKSTDIAKSSNEPSSSEPVVSIVLTCVGLAFVADAVQQSSINAYFGNTEI